MLELTENQYKDIKKVNRLIQKAVDSWTDNNNSGGLLSDNSETFYNRAEKIMNSWGGVINYDYGVGLYPAYRVTVNNKVYWEYSPEGVYKRIIGFWNN